MRVIDCFMYYDEDLVLDIRLNTLNNAVDKFVICEATAVLAGNSLLTLAFEIISHGKNLLSSNKKIEIINLLSNCSGHTGIAGGQELDLKFENKKKGINQILSMQRKKTGKLFNFCFRSVAIVANKSKKDKEFFGRLGEEVGLLFQLSDDFLDLRGSKKLVGKPIKKDKKRKI